LTDEAESEVGTAEGVVLSYPSLRHFGEQSPQIQSKSFDDYLIPDDQSKLTHKYLTNT
jgi:hypothetical protein